MRFFTFSLLSVLALSGCRSVWDPTFMPAGYSYHQNDYKSPPGPEAADIGYKYSAAQNESVMVEWRHALRDLLLKAKANDLQIPQSVFLQTDLRPSAFQGAYDSTLRDELRTYGHVLAMDAGNGPALFYSAYDPAAAQGQVKAVPDRGYNGDQEPHFSDSRFVPPAGNIELAIGVVQDGKWIQKVSGVYKLPLYGYRPGAYVPGHESPVRGRVAPTSAASAETQAEQR